MISVIPLAESFYWQLKNLGNNNLSESEIQGCTKISANAIALISKQARSTVFSSRFEDEIGKLSFDLLLKINRINNKINKSNFKKVFEGTANLLNEAVIAEMFLVLKAKCRQKVSCDKVQKTLLQQYEQLTALGDKILENELEATICMTKRTEYKTGNYFPRSTNLELKNTIFKIGDQFFFKNHHHLNGEFKGFRIGSTPWKQSGGQSDLKVIYDEKSQPTYVSNKFRGKIPNIIFEIIQSQPFGDHPNILVPQLFAYVKNGEKKHKFISKKYDMDLYKAICDRKIPESQKISVSSQIIEAVKCIHKIGYYHADLKLENILVKLESSQIKVVICDFGLAGRVDLSGGSSVHFGTSLYRPPETRSGPPITTVDQGQKGDLYSLGLILYEIKMGETILKNAQGKILLESPDDSYSLMPLIKDLLSEDPNQRKTAFDKFG